MESSSLSGPELTRARNGSLIATIGSLHLHSTFNPESEASRYLDTVHPSYRGSAVIVLGACLGYLTQEVRRRYPAVRIITIDYTDVFRRHIIAEPTHAWTPGERESVHAFVRRVLPEEELAGLAVIEWPPAQRAFPNEAAHIAREIEAVLSEMNANVATGGYFGRRWLRNAVSNFLGWDAFASLPGRQAVTVIAASGPSLERCIPVFERNRERIQIWALASAVLPLTARGVRPDLVILTDPGFYGVEHLWPIGGTGVPVVMPLTAARGVWTTGSAVIPLHMGSAIEDALTPHLGHPLLNASQNGTVAGTALGIALSYAAGAIVFAGFDLALHDMKSHASPHAFDRYLRLRENRLAPETSLLFERNFLQSTSVGGTRYRTTRAHATFARWFEAESPRFGRRIYRLFPSPTQVPMAPLDEQGIQSLLSALQPGEQQCSESARVERDTAVWERTAVVREVLANWREELVRFFQEISASSGDLSHLFDRQEAACEILRLLDMPGFLRMRRLLAHDRHRGIEETDAVVHTSIQFLDSLRWSNGV